MTLALRQIRHTPLRVDGAGAPTVASGYYLWEPSKPYDDGTGRVEQIPLQVNIDGAAVTVDIPVTPGDFSWAWKVTGHLRGQKADTVEYVRVPTGTYATVLDFEDLVRVDGSTLGPVSSAPSALELRIQALESTPPGSAAGVSSFNGRTGAVVPLVADPSNITATGIALGTAANAAAGRTALDAAQTAHTHAVPAGLVATGTPSSTTFLRGDGAWATPSGLDASALANTPMYWPTVSGVYPARPATLRPVVFTDPNVMPANTGSTSGGGGMVPGLDYWIS